VVVNVLIAAIGFRVSASYDCWVIGQKPVSTTGVVTQRRCNSKGGCWIDYEFSVGDQRFIKRQTDGLHFYRVGMPVEVVYNDGAPEFSIAGSLSRKTALEFLDLLLLPAVFTPIPASILIWLYLANVAPSEARQTFLTGYRFVEGRHRFAYAPIWGLLCFAVALGWGGTFTLVGSSYVLLGIAQPGENVLTASIGGLSLFGLFFVVGANGLRVNVEVSANQVRESELIKLDRISHQRDRPNRSGIGPKRAPPCVWTRWPNLAEGLGQS